MRFLTVFSLLFSVVQFTPLPADAKPRISPYSHIVVVVEENHSYSEIIDSSEAPFINRLANSGALFTNSHAITHPSEPNYFALYAGNTFGVSDDADHFFTTRTVASVLKTAHRTVAGYVDTNGPRKHNPWESFSDSSKVGKSIADFPSDYTKLPSLAFVVPNLNNDMHDGSIATGDAWLKSTLSRYARWALKHNSLLIVTFDEDDKSEANRIVTIFYGARVKVGEFKSKITHYTVLRTITEALGAAPVGLARRVAPITQIFK